MCYSCILNLEINIRGKNRLSRQKGKMVILRLSVVKLIRCFISIPEVVIASLSLVIDEWIILLVKLISLVGNPLNSCYSCILLVWLIIHSYLPLIGLKDATSSRPARVNLKTVSG